ncbi:DNA primase large subunit [Methanolinea mesophila]|uniref:DNA primase regulatory subunit PriL n=1 Tax=Methanolinea mesophila TaxID=547055 RepID=UPI001AE43328|nr:DNA primase regulatory subunit PriL [Methanolinea mesophila]MBP1927841.1 DNA primase large subunit [Methanolinea mesophila]
MKVALELKDFAKYPFLKESQQFIREYADTIGDFIGTNPGKIALKRATGRVSDALGLQEEKAPDRVPTERFEVKLEVAGYALARVLVSCQDDRSIIDRLCRYEAARAFRYLLDEDDDKKEMVASSLGIHVSGRSVPLFQYVEMVSGMREDRWRLVNREVDSGRVQVNRDEMNELIREQLRVILARQLPLKVPGQVCADLQPYLELITTAYQERLIEDMGEVEEGSFPPCIQAILTALTGGTNITHAGRFALTAFLHNIGMDKNQIVELYCRAPDFDVSKTLYQVEHISGRGGTEYTAPGCASMRTFGLCVNRDEICGKVNHPLNYYRRKKKRSSFTQRSG